MDMSIIARSSAIPPAPAGDVWTLSDLDQFPRDGRRYEVLHGELLVTPPPSFGHQVAAADLSHVIRSWCKAHTQWAVLSPSGFYVSETTWLEPDLAVFPVKPSKSVTWKNAPVPVLVVEVLSPSTQRRDRHAKRAAYLAHDVGEVWLLDVSARVLERWTRRSEFPETHRDGITWTPLPTAPPLALSAHVLFGTPDAEP